MHNLSVLGSLMLPRSCNIIVGPIENDTCADSIPNPISVACRNKIIGQ